MTRFRRTNYSTEVLLVSDRVIIRGQVSVTDRIMKHRDMNIKRIKIVTNECYIEEIELTKRIKLQLEISGENIIDFNTSRFSPRQEASRMKSRGAINGDPPINKGCC